MSRKRNSKEKRVTVMKLRKFMETINDDQTGMVCEIPRNPTPRNLYVASRMEELRALGNAVHVVFSICTIEYNDMSDEQKVVWILQALKKQPAYKVL